jgi:hypothetical protein
MMFIANMPITAKPRMASSVMYLLSDVCITPPVLFD